MITCSCSHLRVDPHVDTLSFEFVFVVDQSIQSTNIECDSFAKSIGYLPLRDEILCIHDVLRVESALESFMDLSWRHHINLSYS